jgi:hypothetical protein
MHGYCLIFSVMARFDPIWRIESLGLEQVYLDDNIRKIPQPPGQSPSSV